MKLKDYVIDCERLAIDNGLEKEAIKKILIEVFYVSYENYLNNLDMEINTSKFDIYINRYLINKEPVQYIIGFTYFYNCRINVNKDVLIPRGETEILVEESINLIENKNYQNILEIGTGSGAIAIALFEHLKKQKMTKFQITATDISIKALEIAKNNAIINNADITFIESDVYSHIENKYDIIISNPPYIAYEDIDEVWDIVKDNEPHLALFTDDNGLYFYKKIIQESRSFLNGLGTIIFEIGYKQAEAIKKIAYDVYPNAKISVVKDYNRLDRVLIISVGE